MFSASAVLTSPSVERVRRALERAGLHAEIVELLRITGGTPAELAA